VGAGTARADRYRQARPDELWQQLRAGRPPAPPVAVITRRLDLDLGSRLFVPGAAVSCSGLARTLVLTTELASPERVAAARGVADVVVAGEKSVTAVAAAEALTALGYRRILLEGGPNVLAEFAADGLVDELCLTISPVLEGGYEASRLTARSGQVAVTGLRLATVIEDDGFLLTRYVRA